jgi:hypothetical protein
MSQSAHVASIDAVSHWKATLGVFRADAQEALTSSGMEIRRASDWLRDKLQYWQHEVRRWEEEVVQAKAELRRRKMMPTALNREPDCTVQEKALRKAQERLAHAEAKLAAARRWGPALQRAVEEYESQARQLQAMLEGDVVRALVLLEQKLASLEAYVSLAGLAGPVVQAPRAVATDNGDAPAREGEAPAEP